MGGTARAPLRRACQRSLTRPPLCVLVRPAVAYSDWEGQQRAVLAFEDGTGGTQALEARLARSPRPSNARLSLARRLRAPHQSRRAPSQQRADTTPHRPPSPPPSRAQTGALTRLITADDYLVAGDELRPRHRLSLVFVSACHSDQCGGAFVAAGVPHVIAVRRDAQLQDKAAVAFADQFYFALLKVALLARLARNRAARLCCRQPSLGMPADRL